MTDGPWTVPDLWTRRRAHRSLENRGDAVSHTAHRQHQDEEGRKKTPKNARSYLEPLSLEANTG
jgi:hypothetical protein